MSTTIPLPSSRSAINAARTTKVAPWSSCAGPKTLPRNECAIMIWPLTSTAYKRHLVFNLIGSAARIADQRTRRAGVRGQHRRQSRRQLLEGHGRRQQAIERCIVQQRQRRRQPACVAPARAMRGRDPADLTGDKSQAAAVKLLAEGRRDVASAIPAQLDDGCLLAREPQRR